MIRELVLRIKLVFVCMLTRVCVKESRSEQESERCRTIPGLGRSSGDGNGNPLQFPLENPMDRGTWKATVQGVARVGHDLASKPPHNYMGFPGGSAGKEST